MHFTTRLLSTECNKRSVQREFSDNTVEKYEKYRKQLGEMFRRWSSVIRKYSWQEQKQSTLAEGKMNHFKQLNV